MRATPIVLALLASCSRPVAPAAIPRAPAPRELAADQDARAVALSVWCAPPPRAADSAITMWPIGYGSGVAIDARRVLTAAHVVACPAGSAAIVVVDDGRGAQRFASAARSSAADDIAVVTLDAASPDLSAPPVVVGPPPGVGDAICADSAQPARGHSCGVVSVIFPDRRFRDAGAAVPGNSGSGAYDLAGRLVGLVTDRYLAAPWGRRVSEVGADWLR